MPAKKILNVEFDVTGMTKAEIGALEGEAVAQGEASDGLGGKRYHGETGHPDVAVLGSKVTKIDKRAILTVTFDVTALTKSEIGQLASEVEVQGEESDDHPDSSATAKII